MDCKTARLLFDFVRPKSGELDAAELADFEQHLAGCPECDSLSRAERGVDFAIGKVMRAVEVPAGLQNRLMERLDRERGDVYLRWFGHAGRVAAAAAVVIAAVWGVYAWNQAHLPKVDMAQAEDDVHNSIAAPPAEDFLADYFQREGYAGGIPKLNYPLLADYGMHSFQGRQVPQLIFVNPQTGSYAKVRLLSAKQFNLASPPYDFQPAAGYPVKLVLWPDVSGSAAEVEYTGDSPNWIRRQEDAQ
jgi:hypothetical protein